ncbi:MAG: hypothetical protein OEN23_07910 [Paracoccaceae bacterium]|nr:hypothetical protein [Paracoccaceae bacterium]
MLKTVLAIALASAIALPAAAGEIASSVVGTALPKSKQTPLGLYLTPQDAHSALSADPGIVFIDVRDPIEIAFIGHAAGMDANVPVRIATHRFDAERGRYAMAENPNFLA